mmetsp:Transcript_57559/g.106341  ORF Transcript_57559/g.106341 Transcript_57559/m.106341 type:complete len:220 (-) Transcript_57559:293-952(-)
MWARIGGGRGTHVCLHHVSTSRSDGHGFRCNRDLRSSRHQGVDAGCTTQMGPNRCTSLDGSDSRGLRKYGCAGGQREAIAAVRLGSNASQLRLHGCSPPYLAHRAGRRACVVWCSFSAKDTPASLIAATSANASGGPGGAVGLSKGSGYRSCLIGTEHAAETADAPAVAEQSKLELASKATCAIAMAQQSKHGPSRCWRQFVHISPSEANEHGGQGRQF